MTSVARISALVAVLFLCSFSKPASAVESHPGLDVESMYSEAVLAYNKKQSDAAIKILQQLLQSNPNHVEGLELMAISLKEKGDEKKAVEVYERLIKLKPEKERGPYYFELAMMNNKNAKPLIAKQYFEHSLSLGFNTVTSHLFLGLIDFNMGNIPGAKNHFNEVKSDGTPEFKLLSRYYLGLIHFKEGYAPGGTAELTAARNLARDQPNNKMAQDLAASIDKILTPFNASQWFGNITLLGQSDSNIALIPSGVGSTQASNQSTTNFLLNGGLGYMTSPTHDIQWVGSYRFSGNKTTNPETKRYEYLSHTPSLYVNYRPLAQTSGGLKLEGNLTFENLPRDSSASGDPNAPYIFKKYSASGEIGPYLRHEFAKGWQMQLEAGYKTQTNYDDPSFSGPDLNAKLTIKGSTQSSLLNPAISVVYDKQDAESTEYKYNSMGGGILNTMKISANGTFNVSLDILRIKYPQHSMNRADTNLSTRASYIYSLTPKWSLLGDLAYVKNTSNLPDSYSYGRTTFSAGVGWSL